MALHPPNQLTSASSDVSGLPKEKETKDGDEKVKDVSWELEKAHAEYAKVLDEPKIDAAFVREKWNKNLDSLSAREVTSNVENFNRFLAFVQQADPLLSADLYYARQWRSHAAEELKTGQAEPFLNSVEWLQKTNQMAREKILRAARIYGIKIQAVEVTAMAGEADVFAQPVIEKVKTFSGYFKDGTYWIEYLKRVRTDFQQLFTSVTLTLEKENGESAKISFENFKVYIFPVDEKGGYSLFSFESGQGAYGAVATDLVGWNVE
ncbi:MAG: hypothetical protein U1F57_01350 [bacterium]